MAPKKTKVVDPQVIAAEVNALRVRKTAEAAAAAESPEAREARLKEEAQRKFAQRQREKLDARRKRGFEGRFWWTVVFWGWILFIHVAGIGLFTSGFLLTRLVLDEKSSCDMSPASTVSSFGGWANQESSKKVGCWYPKKFERAVVILIDALRYDFTVPIGQEGRNGQGDGPQVYHNAFPIMYDLAVTKPDQAFLLPFIADPPTTTLQRLKGLTTGTLPTFIDMGSNFAGTAIEEDNILMQLRDSGKRIVHLGDDTWTALFPGYFEANISHAYDSFNVWDLHTVDTGVLTHIFPLMKPERRKEWDFAVGHFLGVDHAGHRYGPDHEAMRAKLQQMNDFVAEMVQLVDEDTLLVVMGDHGMDGKGDHGGESDDEVESSLWMYSSRPGVFGRTSEAATKPPPDAKTRPVNQIDIVPTLALLLGIPIPFNNLGKPIEEAFITSDKKGDFAWNDLVVALQVTAAGVNRYLDHYFAARGLRDSAAGKTVAELWQQVTETPSIARKKRYTALVRYQIEALHVCKGLWARFDIPAMVMGIIVMLLGVLVLLLYVSRDANEDSELEALENEDLLVAEGVLEITGAKEDKNPSYQTITRSYAKIALATSIPILITGVTFVFLNRGSIVTIHHAVAVSSLSSIVAVVASMLRSGKVLTNLLPQSLWGIMATVFTASQSVGFAANSFTIWEDSILLFFLSTFGLVCAAHSFRLQSPVDRTLGVYHSLVFVVLGRIASVSKLCREEQMPYCTSTYYASATSSTSSFWQLFIPLTVAIILPSVIRSFMAQSRSYEGLAPTWIGIVFRTGLGLVAFYWLVDAADNGNWFGSLPSGMLKKLSVQLARVVLALAVIAGSTAFVWAPPCVSVHTTANPITPDRAQVTILGYGNVNGARYLLLLINCVGVAMLLTKPMGIGAIASMVWQTLCLVEIIDLNGLTTEPIGPIVLAMLGNFYYFKTGHQAVLSSIQWDSAFIPLTTIRYPWSPLAVIGNHFAGQILAVAATPLLVLWKTGPRRRALLEGTSHALGMVASYYAVEATATMMWAGHLRRHLMLYRVFSPRFMLAAAILLVVDLCVVAISLVGTRTNWLAVGEVFGFAD